MAATWAGWLRDQARSLVGAYLLGLPLLYTMETWWFGWTGPDWLVLTYSLVGLLIVFVVVHFIGFKPEHQGPERSVFDWAQDFAELVLVSFVAAYLVLLLFGILDLSTPPREAIRLGLVQVVPLGFGAAVANRALGMGEEANGGPKPLKKELGVFALGAIFFAMPVAPTEEMELMAAHAGWTRMVLIVVAAVALTYTALYVLEFRGHKGRSERSDKLAWRLGETFAGYLVALTLGAAMLFGFGHFNGATFPEMVQQTVVISFIASVGGAAARVVI